MGQRRTYEPIPEMTPDQVDAAIVRNDAGELRIAVLAAALYAEDSSWAESVCQSLSRHGDPTVRANAVLGFGHIARIHGRLSEALVRPVVEAALRDLDSGVRGQAVSAADDIEHFLGWRLAR